MSKQSAENYLDELLNSVNQEEKKESVENTINAGSNSSPKAKAEAEFLMEFEQELAGDDYDDFLRDFEKNNIQPEDRLSASDMGFTDDDALMSMLGGDFGADIEPEPEQETTPVKEEISLEELALSGLLAEEISVDGTETTVDSNVGPTDAIDLSQMGEEDLISLLAGADDLADIGQLLSKNDNEVPVEADDPFAAFAESEMAGDTDANVKESKEAGKAKKGTFLEKLTNLLFGKEEEEKPETVSLVTESAPGVEVLSDENAEILAAFAEADKIEATEKEDTKKTKKEKKKKEPKIKKAAKPKAPKKPKPKKPKEVDKTPPLPKGPVALVCLLAVSIFVLVYFGTGLLSYTSAMSKAKDYYKMGHYDEAAKQLYGVEIKDDDTMFYGKITTLAAVDSEITAYEVFLKHDRKAEALDSLISAAGRCEVNDENTLTFDCAGEMGVLKDEIIVELQEEFGMTYDEAISLYQLTERDRNEYTIALNKVMEELGIITE